MAEPRRPYSEKERERIRILFQRTGPRTTQFVHNFIGHPTPVYYDRGTVFKIYEPRDKPLSVEEWNLVESIALKYFDMVVGHSKVSYASLSDEDVSMVLLMDELHEKVSKDITLREWSEETEREVQRQRQPPIAQLAGEVTDKDDNIPVAQVVASEI